MFFKQRHSRSPGKKGTKESDYANVCPSAAILPFRLRQKMDRCERLEVFCELHFLSSNSFSLTASALVPLSSLAFLRHTSTSDPLFFLFSHSLWLKCFTHRYHHCFPPYLLISLLRVHLINESILLVSTGQKKAIVSASRLEN